MRSRPPLLVLALTLAACGDKEGSADDSADPGCASPAAFFPDGDGDGFGVSEGAVTACEAPSGFAARDGDCDDADAAVHPETSWAPDGDGDGYGSDRPEDARVQCEAPEGHVLDASDCDDADAAVNPEATWWADRDGDGFGTASGEATWRRQQCEAPEGYTLDASDCDDGDPTVFPGAAPDCDDEVVNACDMTQAEEDEACAAGPRVLADAADLTLRGPGVDAALGSALEAAPPGSDGVPRLLLGSPHWQGGAVWVVQADARGDLPVEDLDDASLCAGSDTCGDVVRALGNVADGARVEVAVSARGSDAAGPVALLFFDAGADLPPLHDPDAVVEAGVNTGQAVAFAGPGDLDGDGRDDLVMGTADAGMAWILHGKISEGHHAGGGTSGLGDLDLRLTDPESGSGFGAAVLVADFDGDGRDDLAVGAPGASGGRGAVYVFDGYVRGSPTPADADGALLGADALGGLGEAMALAGDVDGDGLPDLLLGAPRGETTRGESGGAAHLSLAPFRGTASAATAALTVRSRQPGERLGASVAAGLDVDGDGTPDLLLGAPAHDGEGVDSGAAFLFSGGSAGALDTLDAAARVMGLRADDRLGHSVALVPDTDADGRAELLVGAPGDDDAALASGAVHLFTGATLSDAAMGILP